MKAAALGILAAVSLSACASGPAPMVENGYQIGSLGLAAIERGDWKTAEKQLLKARGMKADDPARLINLGKVYMATGRPGQALSAWRLALAADEHFMVETMDGRKASTREIAQKALAMHETGVRSAGLGR